MTNEACNLKRATRPNGVSFHSASFSSRAFSMLELIIVMMVIATLLAVAAPSLRGFYSGQRTINVARQMLGLMQLAQHAAVNEGRVYRFNLDVDTGLYWLTMQEGAAFIELEYDLGATFALPDTVTVQWLNTSGEPVMRHYVDFYPTGRVEPAALRLRGQLGETVDLICLAATERFHLARDEDWAIEMVTEGRTALPRMNLTAPRATAPPRPPDVPSHQPRPQGQPGR